MAFECKSNADESVDVLSTQTAPVQDTPLNCGAMMRIGLKKAQAATGAENARRDKESSSARLSFMLGLGSGVFQMTCVTEFHHGIS
jgi:hypothetical protein